ncbi:GNAT family N-acetyltransferase [Clostridium sp. AM58-1XD]|uniref:GNAT family N-acetyltransferase n=1 Tax=Clostridium sp. AM58-1XD TaxID=2292307 RepID=UPI000E4EF3B2|nr:GNAT family N-acetyltransferase [Clostridium sp. AM58-1XD]RGY98232.1 GNAT family N-acetyltransferase [Clostridium sp. AM58-1XD]
MEIIIRQAGIGDLETMMSWRMEVLREVFSIPEEQDLTALEQANRSYYQTMMKTDGHVACFACSEEIIGCGGICIYQEMPSPDNPTGLCAYLMNIYIRPQFRGQGAGKRIVLWLMEQAMQRGITKIYLETSDCGRKLYQKIGFTPMMDYLKLDMAVFDRKGIIL